MMHTIFFDVGGTIITTKSTLIFFAEMLEPERQDEIFHYLVESFMVYYENENIERFYSVKEIIAIILKKTAQKFNVPDLSGETEKYYRLNHLQHASLFEDTLPALEKLKERKFRMIVCSDADADVLVEQMKMFKIYDFFDNLIISSNVGAYKPHGKMVEEVKKQAREPFSQNLFVGDSRVDMETARRVNIKSALINRSGKFRHDADYRIRSLSEVADIIDNR
jgi:HAD superfamily hydrolase (TIGR01549 family)